MVDIPEELPRRRLSMTVWHQTRPKRGLLDYADPARGPGRYHPGGGVIVSAMMMASRVIRSWAP